VKYVDQFIKAERRARKKNKGLWAGDEVEWFTFVDILSIC
jgi:endonuclease YncB( thermonuclease family)